MGSKKLIDLLEQPTNKWTIMEGIQPAVSDNMATFWQGNIESPFE